MLLELFDAPQQVFICQFPDCCCLALLKTSHGISWHCHCLDITSFSHTHKNTHTDTYPIPVYCCDTEVTWSQVLFSIKDGCCQKYVSSIACSEFWSTLDPYADWFLCTCSAVQAHNGPLCRLSGPMCFAVACGVLVLKWWLRGESAWRACHFVSVALPLWEHICFTQPFFLTCLSFFCPCSSFFSTLIPVYLS